MASRRYARRAVVVGLIMLAALPLAVASCSSAPAPTAEISLNPTNAPRDERITLPETVGLALRHPAPKNRTEHQVLYTVQQAVRSLLHAEYGPGTGDPLLSAYWSGNALTTVRHDVTTWARLNEQPVGVLVVNGMTYSAPGADGQATVSYCANWQHVDRGNATTHVVGAAVQQPGAAGTYTTLTLAKNSAQPGLGARWKVTSLVETPNSPRCKS